MSHRLIKQMMQHLERRVFIDAPLSLGDDGELELNLPGEEDWMAPGINEPASRLGDNPLDGPRFALPQLSTPSVAAAEVATDTNAETLVAEDLAANVLQANVFRVRDTAERPLDPLNPPRLNDPDDTRLGAYSFTLGYNPCGGAPPEFPESVTVRYELSGTASDEDHAGLSGTATFTRDENNQYGSQHVNYLAVDDTLPEPTEDLVVTILPGPGYEPGTASTATTYIQDNDTVALTSLTVADAAGMGGSATANSSSVPSMQATRFGTGTTFFELSAAISPETAEARELLYYSISNSSGLALSFGKLPQGQLWVEVPILTDAATFYTVVAGVDENRNALLDSNEATRAVQANLAAKVQGREFQAEPPIAITLPPGGAPGSAPFALTDSQGGSMVGLTPIINSEWNKTTNTKVSIFTVTTTGAVNARGGLDCTISCPATTPPGEYSVVISATGDPPGTPISPAVLKVTVR